MYPVMMDRITELAGGIYRLESRGHVIYISVAGAIRIITKLGVEIFSKLGADGSMTP